MDIEIIYEDNNIIAAIKPAGVLSQAGDTADMITLLSEGRGEIYPLHRLDKNVGGVMVYAKNKNAAAKMSQMISQNEMSKQYYAVLCGRPAEDSAVLEDLLFKDSAKNKSYVVKRMRKGVKKASL
ncbi:MAG: RluA family pseudouridine synthase, partial [Clostridia bacterium]|nr:RluA family pseudouridine synthase [Clostridia bacterium]